MADKLPSGWASEPLINLAEYLNGAAFSEKHWAKDGLPIIRIEQINNPEAETDKYNGPVIPANYVDSGDLIFSWSATLKVVIWNSGPAVLNQHLYKVVPKKSISRDLLKQILDFNMDRLSGQSQGSTMRHVTRKELSRFRVIYPVHILEQQKIARILQTIDQAIEKTEALIDKYQKIKAGLMHDLFTRGIGPGGQLRPPREKAPELYQDTPMGWIPKEWVFGACEDVCEKVIDCKNRTPPITPEGHPVIRTPNVRDGQFVDEGLVYTNDLSYLIWTARGAPRPGDIVITREAPVGEVCKIPDRYQHACLGQRMMLYRVDPEKIVADYFLYVLQSNAVKTRLELISGGSTVGHVRVGDIRTLWIFYPKSRAEQLRIASALNYISSKLESEEESLRKLNNQKSGLMYDLLAGKVPVKIEQETQTQPVAMVSA